MSNSSAERLIGIEHALRGNANQPHMGFERMLLLLEKGEQAAAAELYPTLRISRQTGSAERRLQKLISGERNVHRRDGIYYIGAVNAQQYNACLRARNLLAEHGLVIDSVLLVEFASNPSQFAAALPISAKISYLCIAGTDEQELAAAAVHEFSHVALSAGNRFLDEGVAYYFELVSQALFPAVALQKMHERSSLAPYDLRTLIAYAAKDDAYFNLILPGNDFHIHASAALLFNQLVQRLGMEKVAQLYQRIHETGREGDATALIEQVCACTIEELDDFVASTAKACAAMSEADIALVEEAYIAGDVETLLQYYTAIFSQGRAAPTADGRLAAVEILVLATGAIERSFAREISRFESAFVRARLLQFLAKEKRGSRFYLIRALMSIANAPNEGSILDGSLLLDEAKTDLELSLAREPDDPFVLSCLARLEWNSAQEGQNGKLRAISLLKRIYALPTYAKYVESTLQTCLAKLEDSPL